MSMITFLQGDVREILPTASGDSFDCIVTSPPYFGLRDYGVDGQIGLEPTLDAYVETMVDIGRELRRVLKPSGTFFLNLGDCYAGSWDAQSRGCAHGSPLSHDQIASHPKGQTGSMSRFRPGIVPGEGGKLQGRNRDGVGHVDGLKPKDLCGVPWRVAFGLQADGWWLRSAIVWHKVNPMPESVTDRPTSSYEMVFMLTKSERYWYDADAVKEQCSLWTAKDKESCRNLRNVWSIASQPFPGAHFATMPRDLAERCIKAGCPIGGEVLDPFGGVGTTGLVADRLGRDCTLIELNPAYIEMARARIANDAPLLWRNPARDVRSDDFR